MVGKIGYFEEINKRVLARVIGSEKELRFKEKALLKLLHC